MEELNAARDKLVAMKSAQVAALDQEIERKKTAAKKKTSAKKPAAKKGAAKRA